MEGPDTITYSYPPRPMYPTIPSGSTFPGRPPRDQPLADQPFYKRLALVADGHLFGQRPSNEFIFDIELATLQRMVIHDLQHQLVEIITNVHNQRNTDKTDMAKARKLLENYSTAIRNYDFMLEKNATAKATGKQDAFRISSEEGLGFLLMNCAGLFQDQDTRRIQENITRFTERDYKKHRANILPCDSRSQLLQAKDLAGFYDRASAGLLGGFALIAPMLIMVLRNDLLTTLIVTSASTVIFAGILALFFRQLKGETILASVAAYAAVLVVFIGASS